MGGYIDPSLAWSDIAWLRSLTNLPIGIKGIQTVADVLKAKAYGVDIIYLSNHGGRALDSAPPALHVLMELRKYYPSVLDDGKGEIWIDGGIRRGTDVVKALCLGAKYVGMGRPFMYALMYGTEGVEQVFESAFYSSCL
jgi:L-lactate dehydrogenase (cytochrome)